MSAISIIIPTFNEQGNIVLLLKKIKKVLQGKKFFFEIVVIDDNSPDGTASVICQNFSLDRSIRLYVRKKEKGLATAIFFGLKKSKGEVIVSMDADFNHPPELIPELVKGLNQADLVIASRFIKGGGMEDKARYFFTLLFNLFLRYVLSFPTTDNMSGFFAIKKEKLRQLPLAKIFQGYGEYHLRLVFLAKKENLKIKEIPVYYQKRSYGQSKSNLFRLFFKYLSVCLKLKLNFNNF